MVILYIGLVVLYAQFWILQLEGLDDQRAREKRVGSGVVVPTSITWRYTIYP